MTRSASPVASTSARRRFSPSSVTSALPVTPGPPRRPDPLRRSPSRPIERRIEERGERALPIGLDPRLADHERPRTGEPVLDHRERRPGECGAESLALGDRKPGEEIADVQEIQDPVALGIAEERQVIEPGRLHELLVGDRLRRMIAARGGDAPGGIAVGGELLDRQHAKLSRLGGGSALRDSARPGSRAQRGRR